jgi:hypothetical protein
VGFLVTNYFSISDMSVLWYVCKFDKEKCVGSRNVSNAMKQAPDFVAKSSFPKWLQARVFHKGHVFHFFSSDGVNKCIGFVMMGPMAISQGDGHVGSVHATKFVWGQVSRGGYFVSALAPSEVQANSSLV